MVALDSRLIPSLDEGDQGAVGDAPDEAPLVVPVVPLHDVVEAPEVAQLPEVGGAVAGQEGRLVVVIEGAQGSFSRSAVPALHGDGSPLGGSPSSSASASARV
jgi:hypothetical protein